MRVLVSLFIFFLCVGITGVPILVSDFCLRTRSKKKVFEVCYFEGAKSNFEKFIEKLKIFLVLFSI